MKFGSWTYDGLRLDMVPERTDGKCAGDIKKFIRHGEWDLTSMLCARQELVYECCPEPYPDITYTLELRRRHMFYFVNMIAPCFLISGLFDFSFFFFVINSDSLRLHWYQGKSFHIRHGTFKYRISVSGLHTKHESSLKCSHKTSQIPIVNPESEVETSYPNTLTPKLSFVQLGYPVNPCSLLVCVWPCLSGGVK